MYRESSGIEKFFASEREGVSHFSVENFLSHSIEKFRWGILRCIVKYRVAKNFLHQSGRGYQISPWKTFCHTVSKGFLGEHFGVYGNFGYRKILCIREGGGIERFLRGALRCIWKLRNIEKFYAFCVSEREGVSHFSVENFLSHSIEKFRWGTLRCIGKFRVSKNFVCIREGGVSHFSVENFLSHSTEKFRWGTLRCIGNFGYRKIFCIREGGVSHFSVENFLSHSTKKFRCRKHFGVSENFGFRNI